MTVEVADIETILGRELTDTETQNVARLTEFAETAIESALPGFSLATGDESVEVNARDNELWTPRYPVTAINSITYGDGVLNESSYQFDEKGKITFGDRSVLNSFEIEPFKNWWQWDSGPYTIDYDYGLDPLPFDIAAAVARIVAGGLRNPEGVKSETLGPYSVTYGDASSVDSLRHQLRRWRRSNTAVALRP